MKSSAGRVRRDAQVRTLCLMGIEHRIRADGKVVVLRSHMEQVLGVTQSARKEKEIEPDWGAMYRF
ncbi:DUF4224 domain-containing protein [Eoetvoesiella caeni]